MALFELILPIFMVIFLGFFLKKGGLFDETFVRVLNQLVYQVFLPVLVFWEISRAPFQSSFNPRLVLIAYAAMGFIWLSVLGAGKLLGFRRAQVGTLAQGAFRGNLAYIGLAVAFNLYGSPGLSKAGVLTGFLIPFMNFFSILASDPLPAGRPRQTGLGIPGLFRFSESPHRSLLYRFGIFVRLLAASGNPGQFFSPAFRHILAPGPDFPGWQSVFSGDQRGADSGHPGYVVETGHPAGNRCLFAPLRPDQRPGLSAHRHPAGLSHRRGHLCHGRRVGRRFGLIGLPHPAEHLDFHGFHTSLDLAGWTLKWPRSASPPLPCREKAWEGWEGKLFLFPLPCRAKPWKSK